MKQRHTERRAGPMNIGDVPWPRSCRARPLRHQTLFFWAVALCSGPASPKPGLAAPSPEDPGVSPTAQEEEARELEEESLAQRLTNPVADIISIPFQNNVDFGIGPSDSTSYQLLFQPVLPLGLSENLLLINRLIAPVISAEDGEGNRATGLGDLLYSAFFSSADPVFGWLIAGVGPVLSLPTSTESAFSPSESFGVGPTAVVLTIQGPLTVGVLANHIRFVDGRDADSQTFVQFFSSYTFKETGTVINLGTEATFLERPDTWQLVVIPTLAQLLPLGPMALNVSAGPRFFPYTPGGDGADIGFRVQISAIVPR